MGVARLDRDPAARLLEYPCALAAQAAHDRLLAREVLEHLHRDDLVEVRIREQVRHAHVRAREYVWHLLDRSLAAEEHVRQPELPHLRLERLAPRALAAQEEDDVLAVAEQRCRLDYRLEPVLDSEQAGVHDDEPVAERVLRGDSVLAWERPEELDVRAVRQQPPL